MIFGTRAVIEALQAGKTIEKVFLQKDINNARTKELLALLRGSAISLSSVPVEKLNRLTPKKHQGVIAYLSAINFAQLPYIVANSYENGAAPLILILDRITDVRNFGAICRSALCAGADAVLIPDQGSAMINSDAIKTSAGALHHLPVCKEANLLHAVKYLKASGLQVIACTEKSEKRIYQADWSLPSAMIVGSEEDGISDALLATADVCLKIPMQGRISSLNVSVATGVALFECVRQRL